MKLNIGCGGRRIPGYTGVDAVQREGADVVADAGSLPFEDCSADEVMAIHLVEHLYPWLLPPTLAEWFRVLKPGGRLVLEMPDIIKSCKNLIDGVMRGGKHPNQLSYWAIYGDDRLEDEFMMHKYGYHFGSLKPIVESAGFIKIKEFQTQFHPAGRNCRDFRLEAIKP